MLPTLLAKKNKIGENFEMLWDWKERGGIIRNVKDI